MKCRVQNEPTPAVVTWFKNEVELSQSERLIVVHDASTGDASLQINSVVKEDEGEYKIVAQYPDEKVWCSSTLVVNVSNVVEETTTTTTTTISKQQTAAPSTEQSDETTVVTEEQKPVIVDKIRDQNITEGASTFLLYPIYLCTYGWSNVYLSIVSYLGFLCWVFVRSAAGSG